MIIRAIPTELLFLLEAFFILSQWKFIIQVIKQEEKILEKGMKSFPSVHTFN